MILLIQLTDAEFQSLQEQADFELVPLAEVVKKALEKYHYHYYRVVRAAESERLLVLKKREAQLQADNSRLLKDAEENARKIQELEKDAEDEYQTIIHIGKINREIAEILKGPPAENTLHDWSDLPQRVRDMKAELEALKRG